MSGVNVFILELPYLVLFLRGGGGGGAPYNGKYVSSQIFENIPQNGPEYSHRKLAIARFLVTAVRKKHRRLAVPVGLIVKFSP